jgi:GTPase SAR1 family protein
MSTAEEYKIAICGGGAVGKSSITVQYTQNQFLDEYVTFQQFFKIFSSGPNHSRQLHQTSKNR